MNVKLLEWTPNADELIYKAYRQCYSKNVATEIKIPKIDAYGSVPDRQKMIEFIKDKIDKGHFSPLEHASFTFSIEGVSRSCSHELVRYRTFKFSQSSQRYIDGSNFSYVTPEKMNDNRIITAIEYSDGYHGTLNVHMTYDDMIQTIFNMYEALRRAGFNKEDARYILPNATTTNLVVTCDLRNFRNFLSQRLCINAMDEIRELANLMRNEVKEILPFVDYKLEHCDKCKKCLVEA